MAARKSSITRETTETKISIDLNVDGDGNYNVDTGIGFLNHMLELFTKHGSFDMTLKADGDLHIDAHHTAEDIGIVMGDAFREALGDKRGIKRYGFFLLPMDETLIECAVDFSGRTYLNFDAKIPSEKVGDFDTELVEEFFKAFADRAGINLHIVKRYGRNTHHIIEGIFKCFARSVKDAVRVESDKMMSTKGSL